MLPEGSILLGEPAGTRGGSLTSAKVEICFDWTKIGLGLDLVWVWVGLTDFFLTKVCNHVD